MATFVPFQGGVVREELDPTRPRDAVRPRARDSGGESNDERRAETEIPKGSYAAGERVKLPAGAEPPFTVFINGVEQGEGDDYGSKPARSSSPARSSRRRSAPAAGWRCTWASSAPTARTRRSTSSSAAAARSSCSPTSPVIPYAEAGTDEHRLPPPLRPQRGRQRQALPDRRRLERPPPPRAAPRVGLLHRPRHRRRLARDQQPPRAPRHRPGPRRHRARRGPAPPTSRPAAPRPPRRPGAAPGDVDRRHRRPSPPPAPTPRSSRSTARSSAAPAST